MKAFFTPLLRRIYVFFGSFVMIYFLVLTIQHSSWNKERLYQKLITGSHDEILSAGANLVYLQGQEQLVRALKSRSEMVRAVAVNSLADIWSHSAGPKAFELTQQAAKAAEKKSSEEALRILTEVTEKYPDFADGWHRRGALLCQLDRHVDAVLDYQRGLALNLEHFGAWQGLALCQVHLGDLEGARESISKALKITPHEHGLQGFQHYCEELIQRFAPGPRLQFDEI